MKYIKALYWLLVGLMAIGIGSEGYGGFQFSAFFSVLLGAGVFYIILIFIFKALAFMLMPPKNLTSEQKEKQK